METMYKVSAIIKEAVYYNRMAYGVPVQLIHTGNREVDVPTLRYYYRKYDILMRDEESFVRDYVNENFTSYELLELMNSGFLNRFESCDIHELKVEGMSTALKFEDIIGFDVDNAKTIAHLNNCALPISILSSGCSFTQGEDVQIFDTIASFPVGMYYNVNAAQAIV